MFKLPCMVSFEYLHSSVWPWKGKTSGTSHRDGEPFVEKGPIGALQRLKTDHAWQFKYEVWVRKIKTKNIGKYQRYQRFTQLNGTKRENFRRMESTGKSKKYLLVFSNAEVGREFNLKQNGSRIMNFSKFWEAVRRF